MFGFETIEIVGGLVGLVLLGLIVWKLSDSEETSDSKKGGGKTRSRSDGKSKGKSTRS